MSFPRYAEYKDSGVEWLGEVPAHWAVWKLAHAFEIIGSGTTPRSEQVAYYDDGEIPWLNTGDLNDGYLLDCGKKVTDLALADHSSLKLYPAESLVIAMYGATIGKLAMLKFASTVNQACCVFSGKSPIRQEFLFHWFLGLRSQIISLATGGGQPNISQEILRNIRLACPDLAEQTAIAAFLDRETAKIDALVAEQQRLIELLKEKRQALISHAVTQGLSTLSRHAHINRHSRAGGNPESTEEASTSDLDSRLRGNDGAVPMKYSGVEWLGKVPAHWKILSLGKITLDKCDGPFGSGLKSEHYTDAGVRVIRLQNIRRHRFDNSDCAFIDEDYYQNKFNGHDVQQGDVLIAGLGDERNTVGRACVAPAGIEPAMVKADCFRFRLRADLASPDFIATQLTAGSSADAGVLSSGSTRSRIPLSIMASRRIALPPVDEQRAIVDWLGKEVAGFDALNAEARRGIALLQERRSALISAAVTGQIDVRGLMPVNQALPSGDLNG